MYMKTNPVARRLVRIRLALTCLAIASVAAVEFGAGRVLATRIGQASSGYTHAAPAPNQTLDDLMLATR